ncbi:hypothetical protein QJS04_geneDACA007584 [Acorus gramineus]|uniref:KIB1-4 beta-propeller domain-containing protein n=1 Tax=Acorus gramineus TaxID=55184 RepID=A0AAV9B1S7_ACOGR|nr:hypothetical protein QJS04_geneDACA007584 [Acorus gramineus]
MSLGDFFAFSHVCREWRFVSEIRKREYMAAQPPLLCGSLIHLSFYSWKEERFYKKEVHQINIRLLNMGFCHGFLISLHSGPDKKYFGLVNPVTGVEVMASFPVLPKCIVTLPLYATLMSPPTSPDCMLLIVAAYFICLCRPGDQEWIIHPRVYGGGTILGMLFFKGKIYGINNRGHILIYDHVHSKFTFCRARNDLLKYDQITKFRRRIWLADCGGELFVILCLNTSNGLEGVKFVVRRFNFTTCKWVSVKHLGNHVLFLDRWGAAFWDDAANWGDSGNCIYYFSEYIHGDKFHVFHMNDGRVENFSFPEHFCPSSWIFPRLCC